MAVITLSRQMGSKGDEVARMVADRLGLRLVGREIINQAALQAGVPEVALSEIDELGLLGMKPRPEALRLYRETVSRLIQELADAGNLLLVGRGGQIILAGREDALHVQVIALRASRINWIQEQRSVTADVAAALVDASDRARAAYLRRHFQVHWDAPELYDLIVNTERLTVSAAAEIIRSATQNISAHVEVSE